MATANFLQIKPNGINLPSNASTVVASAGDIAYNSTANAFAIYTTAADFLLTANTAASTITGLTNSNLSGSAGITNANLASMAAHTVKGNIGTVSATPNDVGLASLSETGSSVLTITGSLNLVGNPSTIQVSQASGSTSGYLSSTDWTTFNSKQGSGNYITSLTGDVTAAGPGAAAATLTATTNSTLTTLSGLTTASSLASVGTITSGTWNATTIAIAHGGTGQTSANAAFNALSPMTTNGDMIYLASGVATRLATPVTNNEILTSISGTPTWTSIASLPIPQGTKNYLTQYTASTSSSQANAGNGNFELGNTSGWSLGTIGTLTNGLPTGTPTFGSGASGNLSLNVLSSGNQIGGSYSGEMVSSAASTVGNMMASSAFFIDAEDQGKVLTFKFYYSPIVGATNLNFSGTSSNSFGVAVWDVTNSTWISVAGAFSMTQNSGVGLATGTFQTNINTASMRFVIYNANASLGAYNLALDDIFVGPQTAPIGPVVTDPVAYTPTFTGVGTVSGVAFYSWREGAHLGIRGTFTTGTPTATPVSITLGYNGANGNVVGASTMASGQLVGMGDRSAAGAENYTALGEPGSNFIYIGIQTASLSGLTANNGSSIISAGQTLSFTAMVPIQGWSSNVQMSSDTDTRVVAMQASGTNNTSFSTTPTGVEYVTVKDSHGAYNPSTGVYTVPVTGWYKVVATVDSTTSMTSGNSLNISLLQNGSTVVGGYARNNGSSTSIIFNQPMVNGEIYCNAGDQLQIVIFSNANSFTINNSVYTYLNISRLSGPSVIAATESVNASYRFVGNTALPNGSNEVLSSTYATYTKVCDSHNAFNTSTGVYTVPVSGKYRASLRVTIDPTASSVGGVYSLLSQGGSSSISALSESAFGSSGFAVNAQVSDLFNCLAGDTITLQALQDNGTSIAIFSAGGSGYNGFSIERVGN